MIWQTAQSSCQFRVTARKARWHRRPDAAWVPNQKHFVFPPNFVEKPRICCVDIEIDAVVLEDTRQTTISPILMLCRTATVLQMPSSLNGRADTRRPVFQTV